MDYEYYQVQCTCCKAKYEARKGNDEEEIYITLNDIWDTDCPLCSCHSFERVDDDSEFLENYEEVSNG